jgi:hypothetical protein
VADGRCATSSSSQNAYYAEKALLHGLVCYLPLFQDKIRARQRVSAPKDTSFQVQLFPSAIREDSLEPAAPPSEGGSGLTPQMPSRPATRLVL